MAKTRQRVRYRLALAVIGALLVTLTITPTGASAAENRALTVMTQNLYLGSSITRALEAATQEEFIEAIARIYATVQYTNFPARAEAIADAIQAKEPDMIGLQEVAKWTTEGLNPPLGYDFLEILEKDLSARGLHYAVAAVAHNAKIGPAPLVVSEQSCPVLEGPRFTCRVTLEDRDVILISEGTPGLTWSNPVSGHYATQKLVKLPVGEASLDRGWVSVDATLNSQPFRFVDTHLETEQAPLIQEAQAAEFLAGPGQGEAVIAAGDFNTAPDGSTTRSYEQLTERFSDAWSEERLGPGWSCCQESDTPPLAPGALNNPVSTLKTRIDLILSRGAAFSSGAQAELVADTPFQAEPPFWPSDHAGVVAQVKLDDLAVTSGSLPTGQVGRPLQRDRRSGRRHAPILLASEWVAGRPLYGRQHRADQRHPDN